MARVGTLTILMYLDFRWGVILVMAIERGHGIQVRSFVSRLCRDCVTPYSRRCRLFSRRLKFWLIVEIDKLLVPQADIRLMSPFLERFGYRLDSIG
jgi:hypothetical protein